MATCTLVAVLALVFAWTAAARGHIEGSVHFLGCGGTQMMQKPGQPPPFVACSSNIVPGAVVVAVQGSTARFDRDPAGRLVVVSPAVRLTVARSDDRGRYQLDLAPGIYMIGANESGFKVVEAGGTYVQMPRAESEFRAIKVVGRATMFVEIGILFGAA